MIATVTFTSMQEKKHSIRYDCLYTDQKPAVTSIYVSKEVLPRPFPSKIRITIEEA